MSILNAAFQALKQAFQRRKQRRGYINKIPGWARFFSPAIEVLEERTLLSANPVQLDGIFAPGNGVPGDTTGIALVNAVSLPETAPSRISYLGYPAQITAASELTVFHSGDIELSSLRPDLLRDHGFSSLV